jgi:pyrimidine deaminase RibD-like protein
MKKFLSMACRFARNHAFAKEVDFPHCALVVSGSKVLGVGFNRHGWSSKQAKHSSKRAHGCCTVHAEVDALLKVATREDVKGSTVYVAKCVPRSCVSMESSVLSFLFPRMRTLTVSLIFADFV